MHSRSVLTIVRLRALAAEALCYWGEPDLEHALIVEQSPRMTRSIAKTYPARRVIRVSPSVPEMRVPEARLVMWHESAHIVVFHRYGERVRPHGDEWTSLLVSAGLPASVRISDLMHGLPSTVESGVTSRHFVYRCPVCHAVAYARRRMPHWRCVACTENGLLGNMIIDHSGP